MEPREFVGASRSEAVSKACKFFGVGEDALDIAEPGEVFGLAARVVVVAAPLGRVRPPPRSMERAEGGRDREREGGRDRDRGRGRDRDGGRDRDRGRRDGGRREAPREREETAAAPPRAASSAPSVGRPTTALGAVGEYVRGIIERMELGPFEISESSESEMTVVGVQGAAALTLGSGDGRAVDAVALLANQAAAKEGDDAKRVVLDVQGEEGNREDYLARLAEKAARRAVETGRSVAIDPMNPRDRRVIHVALRDQRDVATMSVGVGRYRQVVVVPEGAPEYADARRQAAESAANRRDD
jgi:spoIIIJ-associated protein